MIRSQGNSLHTTYNAKGWNIDLLLFVLSFLPFKAVLFLASEGAVFSFQWFYTRYFKTDQKYNLLSHGQQQTWNQRPKTIVCTKVLIYYEVKQVQIFNLYNDRIVISIFAHGLWKPWTEKDKNYEINRISWEKKNRDYRAGLKNAVNFLVA